MNISYIANVNVKLESQGKHVAYCIQRIFIEWQANNTIKNYFKNNKNARSP